jgi:hypothetical protein
VFELPVVGTEVTETGGEDVTGKLDVLPEVRRKISCWFNKNERSLFWFDLWSHIVKMKTSRIKTIQTVAHPKKGWTPDGFLMAEYLSDRLTAP